MAMQELPNATCVTPVRKVRSAILYLLTTATNNPRRGSALHHGHQEEDRSAITGKFMSVASAKAHKKTALVEGAGKKKRK